MEEKLSKTKVCIILSLLLATTLPASPTLAWSNGGYSADPQNPDYGTHDWIAEHALDWLPTIEKQYILNNLQDYLYGTELPDNGGAPDGIGDTFKHHVYYYSSGTLQDDISAIRALEEYNDVLDYLDGGNDALAAKYAGVMSHYIVDVSVFGHVMGSSTDWGAETHHSDYENYVRDRTTGYTSSTFDPYLSFDGSLATLDAYDAALDVAYITTFGDGGDIRSCTWMDDNYDWLDPSFKDSAGASLNLAVNVLADVLHTIAVVAGSGDTTPPSIVSTTPQNSEADVSITQSVVIDFNEAMDATSFSFSIDPHVGGWIWTWSNGDTKLVGTHGDFVYSTSYTFTVTGAEDLAGNPLAGSSYEWTWTTEAEPPTGTISGTVEDTDGNSIVGATVQLKNANTGSVVDTETSDSNGDFGFSDVPFGSYTILVSQVGYENNETVAFTVSLGTRTIDAGVIELEESAQVQKEATLDWLWIVAGPLAAVIMVLIAVLFTSRRKRPAQP